MTDKVLDPTTKAKIRQMSYEDMFRLRRFAPCGHPYFVSGSPENNYFNERMAKLMEDVSDHERVAISKRVGWTP